ncbi:MAG: PEP-CTERM sorting domain-containing protein [Planctomycetota bacterium]
MTQRFAWLLVAALWPGISQQATAAVVVSWDFDGGVSTGVVQPGFEGSPAGLTAIGTFNAGSLTPTGTTSTRWRTGSFSNVGFDLTKGLSLSFTYTGPVSLHVEGFEFKYANSSGTTKRWIKVDFEITRGPNAGGRSEGDIEIVDVSKTSTSYSKVETSLYEALTAGDTITFKYYFARDTAGSAVQVDLDAIKIAGQIVPEPSSWLILTGMGLRLGAIMYRRRR